MKAEIGNKQLILLLGLTTCVCATNMNHLFLRDNSNNTQASIQADLFP